MWFYLLEHSKHIKHAESSNVFAVNHHLTKWWRPNSNVLIICWNICLFLWLWNKWGNNHFLALSNEWSLCTALHAPDSFSMKWKMDAFKQLKNTSWHSPWPYSTWNYLQPDNRRTKKKKKNSCASYLPPKTSRLLMCNENKSCLCKYCIYHIEAVK